MSLCPHRGLVPWLSTVKPASVSPSDTAKEDPSGDDNTMGAFCVIVQFGQRLAEGVLVPCKETKKAGAAASTLAMWKLPRFFPAIVRVSCELQDAPSLFH